MAPSTTIGATTARRRAATKVIVSHLPSGTAPITRTPRGARPLSLTMFVLTAVSSINTSRAGSSIPCSRIQRRRARATSARWRSAACSTFLSVMLCRSRKRQSGFRVAGFDPSLAQFCNRFYSRSGPAVGRSDPKSTANSSNGERSAARLRGGAPADTSAAATLPPTAR